MKYSVKKLAKLAGISVRTLHVYDQKNLLKPHGRTEAGYRYYGQDELYRLQQILFYKELDFSLDDIKKILDQPRFDAVKALQNQKHALKIRRERMDKILMTLDKTIDHLKRRTVMRPEELYEGLPREFAQEHRQEAVRKWGQESIEKSEKAVMGMGKERFEDLKQKQQTNARQLFELRNENPRSEKVQELIEDHYHLIRAFWGTASLSDKQQEAYKGLGQLYTSDYSYTARQGEPKPHFAEFLKDAIIYYAEHRLS